MAKCWFKGLMGYKFLKKKKKKNYAPIIQHVSPLLGFFDKM